MDFVYIGPLDDKSAVNGGYNFIGKNTVEIVQEYKRQFPSFNFECVDNTFKAKGFKKSYYDKCIFLAHPSSFVNKDGSVKNFFFQLLSPIKERYLHIFWETSILPRIWIPLLKSDLFHGFIASSKFVYRLLEQENLGKPIYLLPPYIENTQYPKIDIKEKQKESLFTCLFVGQRTIRKGLDDAIISFVRGLGDKSDCSLLLKYHNMSNFTEFDSHVKGLVSINYIGKMNASISSINQNLSDKQIQELHLGSSLLLFPSRGEGFGLPIIQSASMNLPIISNSGSSLDEFKFLGKGIKFSRHYEDSSVGMAQFGYDMDSNYYIPSINDLISLLRESYSLWKSNRLEYYEQSCHSSEEVNDRFGIENCLYHFNTFIMNSAQD